MSRERAPGVFPEERVECLARAPAGRSSRSTRAAADGRVDSDSRVASASGPLPASPWSLSLQAGPFASESPSAPRL
jgi:hypothetical protein